MVDGRLLFHDLGSDDKKIPRLINNLTKNLQTYRVLLGTNYGQTEQMKSYTCSVGNTQTALPTHLFPGPTAHGTTRGLGLFRSLMDRRR